MSDWGEAHASFVRASAKMDALAVLEGLHLVGRAFFSSEPFEVDPDLRVLLVEQPGLARAGAAVLGTLSEMYGAEMIEKILYARSGYQALLDAGVWKEPPLDAAQLEESDEDILALVEREGLARDRVPAGVPAHHGWWPRSTPTA